MNEKKLIRLCQNGHKEAFNELIELYYPFVYKFLLKTTQNQDIAQDLVQETFIKMIRNITSFDIKKKASFGTYLITIAKNCYIDYIRKHNKEFQEIDITNVADELSIENSIFSKFDYETILEKINQLPPNQRDAIRLKYIEGYTLEEIANRQNVEPKTIKSRLFEARKKLKESVQYEKRY